jgi:hypothetical protein
MRERIELMNDSIHSLIRAHELIKSKRYDIILHSVGYDDNAFYPVFPRDVHARKIMSEILDVDGKQLLPYHSLDYYKYYCNERVSPVLIPEFRRKWKAFLKKEGVIIIPSNTFSVDILTDETSIPECYKTKHEIIRSLDRVLWKMTQMIKKMKF